MQTHLSTYTWIYMLKIIVKMKFAGSFCVAVSDAVQEMHKQLTRSLNIDAPLLAGMKERGLLSQADVEKLQAMLDKGSSRFEIASYFINNILLCWSPGVFVDQLDLFRDALAKHDDHSNQRFAADFNKLLKTTKSHSLTPSSANRLLLTESWRNGQGNVHIHVLNSTVNENSM